MCNGTPLKVKKMFPTPAGLESGASGSTDQSHLAEFSMNIYSTAKETRTLVTLKLFKNKMCRIQEKHVTCKTNSSFYI